MNELKRAFLYIKRKKNNIAVFVILIILILTALLSIAIFQSSKEAQKNIRESLGASFKMTAIINEDPEYQEVITLPNGGTITSYKGPLIDEQIIQNIMGHEGIINYSVDKGMSMYIEDISLFPGLYADTIHLTNTDSQYASNLTEAEIKTNLICANATNLYGCTDSSLHHYFLTGSFELCAGREINSQDSGVVLISDKLAEKNDIELGDTINVEMRECLYVFDGATDKNLGRPINLEVVGFFHVNSNQSVNQYTVESEIADNMMFVSVSDIKTLNEYGGYDTEYDEVTFFVQDPKQLNSIISDIEKDKNIEWDNYSVEEDDTLYAGAIKPLKNMNIFLTVLIIATFVITFITFYIILTIRVKDRKHEIGIYLSIGVAKKKIILQLLLECATIMSAAYIVAGAISAELIDHTDDVILSAFSPEAEESKKITEKEILENSRSGSSEDLFKINEVSGTPKTIESRLSISLIIVLYLALNMVMLVAILVASRPIMQMKPFKIFQDYY
uniref:ABC transporter permease n=1 Tax=Lachnoclostridium phocaeense TaxID=1871021 RepID=UPI0026DB9879|nr:FtsX-like permease family protein [Lachnoclostridium phocaeense]